MEVTVLSIIVRTEDLLRRQHSDSTLTIVTLSLILRDSGNRFHITLKHTYLQTCHNGLCVEMFQDKILYLVTLESVLNAV